MDSHTVFSSLPAQFKSLLKAGLLITCMTSLNSYADYMADQTPPTSADAIRPILIGQSIPEINVKNVEGKSVSLNQLLSEKPTLLVFYRGGWCPYCNLHLANLRKVEQPLKEQGFQIIAISPDKPEELNLSDKKHELSYTLLSDSNGAAMTALGLAFKVDKDTISTYHSYGIDLEKSSGEKHHLLPVPAALLIDTDGIVTFSFINPNYKVRIDNELIMAAANAQIKNK